MEEREIGGLTVNDGGGLYDSAGTLDLLVIDCNEILNDLMENQNIRLCNRLVGMVQKLRELKKGMAAELESRNQAIAELTKENELLRGE